MKCVESDVKPCSAQLRSLLLACLLFMYRCYICTALGWTWWYQCGPCWQWWQGGRRWPQVSLLSTVF